MANPKRVAGGVVNFGVVAAFTAWGLYSGVSARVGHLPDEAMLA